jgi:glycosyltransferase involved in cell wall biosynthesis
VTPPDALELLVPSIVDPTTHRGGAGTTTRTLFKLLERPPLAARITVVPPPRPADRWHRLRQILSVARSLTSSLPAKIEFARSRGLLQAVRRRLREQEFDLVLLNGSDLLWLLPELPDHLPRVLVAHNIEHDLHRTHLDTLRRPWRLLRPLLLRDWKRLHDYEMTAMSRIADVIFLSARDAELARRECPNINPIVIPPLFDYPRAEWARTPHSNGQLDIGLLANFRWWPNRQGLQWFLKEVFPQILGTTRLHLFGEHSQQMAAHHPRVVGHGFVPRIQDVWARCDFMVCPIFYGGGVSVKFAEIVYNGVPVVASSFAARGVPLEPHPSIVLLEGAEDWIRFLRSPAAQELSRRRGPSPLARTFALESHVAPVQAFISEAARRRGQP